MPRSKKISDSTNGESLSQATLLLHLSATIDKLNPVHRAVVLDALGNVHAFAVMLMAEKLTVTEPRMATAKTRIKKVKPVKAMKAPRKRTRLDYDANRLVALRLDQKMSQSDLAKKLKVHFTTISQAERGLATKPLLKKLQDYFGTEFTPAAELDAPSYSARLIKQGVMDA